MTKLKNTKKGMAKKALSISLVAAMLATSNVPVWAAEFSDGTEAAPVVVEESADVEAFTDEAAPVVEEVVEDVAPASEETIMAATDADINVDGYVSTIAVKMNSNGWGNEVTVTGSLKNKSGSDVYTWDSNDKNESIQVGYTWLSDGLEANGYSSNGVLSSGNRVNTITYTPTRDDFNKNLSLMVYVKRGNTVVYQQTFNGGTVGAQDISAYFTGALSFNEGTSVEYNGKEQKLVPTNTYTYPGEFGTITEKHITWNYKEKENDFTNVTGEDITVTGTLEGTYDKTSDAYGYKATTGEGHYQIAPLPITADNLISSMKTTSVQYTGDEQKFGESDITLQVKVNDDNTKVDISGALKKLKESEKISGATAVGTGYTLDVTTDLLDNSEAAEKILKNFQLPAGAVAATMDNSYSIVVRDLSKCTGEVNADFEVDDFKNKTAEQLKDLILAERANIRLTGADGKSFTLGDIENDVTLTIEQALITAAEKGNTGVVNNAITIAYKADTKNVTGKISLPIRLTTRKLSGVDIIVNNTSLSTNPDAPTDLGLAYIDKAYDLTAKKYGITTFEVDGLKTGEYSISYNDNVNAGTVKVTLTGLGSYAGSIKNFYFKIAPNTVAVGDVSMKDKVTVNPANNADASKYKDALELSIKKELYPGNGKTTLELDKDYTVKYYYVDADTNVASLTTENDVKAAAGDNVAGDYVCAVVKVKKGNYEEVTFIKTAKILKKSISNVTISVEKDSYTYTAKPIVPEIVVKDGSSVLEKGVDYSLLIKDNVEVGTATITIKALSASDYEPNSTATATFNITPAKAEDVTVVLGESTSATAVKDSTGKIIAFAYNKGKQIKPVVEDVIFNGVSVKEQFDTSYVTYGDNNAAGKDMGSIVLSPKANNKNFTGTKTQLFDIKGKELNGTLKIYGSNKKQIPVNTADPTADNYKIVSWNDYHFYYNGGECTFADEAFLANPVAATEGTDYEIKYIDNVNAGYGYVVVVAKGNYEGDFTYIDKWTDDEGNEHIDNYLGDYTFVDGKMMLGSKVVQNNIVDVIAFEIRASVFTAKNITVTNGVYASGLPVQPQVTISVAGKTLVEGKDYKLNIRPQDSDTGFTYPASVINATTGKPFYVDVIPMGGYEFDDIDGSNTFAWGIDQFDFAAADIQSTGNTVTVKNGTIVVDPADYVVTTDEAAGTITVSAKEGSKNYKGSQTVKLDNAASHIAAPMIKEVQVVGNKATVILSGEAEGATGYDYVISTVNNYKDGRLTNGINKNQLSTQTSYQYLQQGVYYAYCHAWTRDENGKKVFGGWSNIYPFSVSAITPEQPTITSVKTSGSTVTVTYTKAANATGYDIVLGSAQKKVNGELRPVEYGTLVKKVTKGNTVTATFKNVKKGTYYAGLHAYNRTSEDGKKVFSPWSNIKKVTVK